MAPRHLAPRHARIGAAEHVTVTLILNGVVEIMTTRVPRRELPILPTRDGMMWVLAATHIPVTHLTLSAR